MRYLIEQHPNSKWIISQFVDGMSVTDGVEHFILTPEKVEFESIEEAFAWGREAILVALQECSERLQKSFERKRNIV